MKTALILVILTVMLMSPARSRVHQDPGSQQSQSQATQAPQDTQAAEVTQPPQDTQTQAPQETQAPQTTQPPQITQAPQETQAPQTTQTPQVTQAPQDTQAPQTTEAPQGTEASEATQPPQATQAPQDTQAPEATQAPQDTQAPETTQAPEMTQTPQETQATQPPQQQTTFIPSTSPLNMNQSESGEIFYGAMLTGEAKCDVNSKANSIRLPDMMMGEGRVEISSGNGYMGAISIMLSALEEKAKTNPKTSDLLAALIPKPVITKLLGDFQSGCSPLNQTQGTTNTEASTNSNTNTNTKNRRQETNCNLQETFTSFDAELERQARASLQDFSPLSSPNGLRENKNDATDQLDITSNLWGLVIDRLVVLLGGERINPTLTSHWKSVVKTQWLSLNDSTMIELESLAMWAFATDDLSTEWDSTLSLGYEALSIRGKIFFAFYLKNRNVNAGAAGLTLERERIDLYQNVLKLAMDRIRIDHFGNTAFVTVADYIDGPERADYQATAMLLFLINKFGIAFDLKPTKMANFLASFGRQGDLEFPIEKFKTFNDSRELVWAIVAMATRPITVDVDLELRVVSEEEEVMRHQFKRCCDVVVKSSFSSLVQFSAGKTLSFVACGAGDISIAFRFVLNQNSSISPSPSPSSAEIPPTEANQGESTQSPIGQDQSTQTTMDQSTQGPMDQSTQGPMDQSTQGTMDQSEQSTSPNGGSKDQ